MLKETKKILVVAPHPDDETLGCGGTILKNKAAGNKICWLLITSMEKEQGFSEERIQEREREIEKVSKEYGFDGVFRLNMPTKRLDTIPNEKIINAVSDVINKVMPDTVFLPNRSDAHSDHKIVFDSAMSSLKTFRTPFVKKILVYETISETEFGSAICGDVFVPNSFSDITEFLDRKIAIMQIYKGELSQHPFPRSPENMKALAVFRGAAAGVIYAEAFMLLKEIW
ncbi:MAG: PIG-L family deacetylase [Nitrospirae bacterium]|nr:PIG-L family deacetylase [Nitrospirota bacterium]